MKIQSIAISNSLSFALQEPTLTPTATFLTSGNSGSQHVLIGPNGAGKSNFIEIVSHCLRKALFQHAQFSEGTLMAEKRGDSISAENLRQVITIATAQLSWRLRQHDASGSDLQRFAVSLELNDNDFRNLEFLLNHAEEINAIVNKYSNAGATVPLEAPGNLRTHAKVTATIDYQASRNSLVVAFESEDDPAIAFIKSYLRNFQVLQMCITLYNRYLRSVEDPQWPELQETFAMLSSYRNYGAISSGISIDGNRSFQPVYDRLKSESTRSGGGEEPAVFDMVKRKIGYAFYDLYHDHSYADTLTGLFRTEPLASINGLLSRYLNLEIKVAKLNRVEPALEMHFERDGGRVDTSDLSSGEKGILHFIFTIYGFDLKNGVIVIDEPELHLHPQIQKEYQAIITETSAQLDIQFIIATHSPLFVGTDTIEQVYRFYKRGGHTEVVNPIVTAPQKALVKILDLTNSARIFFVNKVILVEGATDEYFLRFLLDDLRKTAVDSGSQSWQQQIKDYEIVSIKGKSSRKVFTEFLESFGLDVSFIGDWDSVSEIAEIHIENYAQTYFNALKTAGSAIRQKGSTDGAALFAAIDRAVAAPDKESLEELNRVKAYIVARATDYPSLMKHIKDTDASEWDRLDAAITNSYAQKIFVLKQGELEHYLGLDGKGIEQTRDFCQNAFSSWLTDPSYTAHRDELFDLVRRVFQ